MLLQERRPSCLLPWYALLLGKKCTQIPWAVGEGKKAERQGKKALALSFLVNHVIQHPSKSCQFSPQALSSGLTSCGSWWRPSYQYFPPHSLICLLNSSTHSDRHLVSAFERLCWRRLLRVPWTARGSNLSILKEISPVCSLAGMMLKLKL